MKKEYFILSFSIFFLFTGSMSAIGEKVLIVGAGSGWDKARLRTGIAEVNAVRPYPVLLLSSARPADREEDLLDLALSFDEENAALFKDSTGNYQIKISPVLFTADRRMAIAGTGAARFSRTLISPPAVRMDLSDGVLSVIEEAGREDPLISGFGERGPLSLIPRQGALLAPGAVTGDFTIEFWLFPANMENGEQILSWTASKFNDKNDFVVQRIQAAALKNRLLWTFDDFFAPIDGRKQASVTLNGITPLVPRTWSHHLICFDSSTGLLEYIVNGKIESLSYATQTGSEGSEVYTPIIGEDSILILGGRFTGLMDEFRIHKRFQETSVLEKYPIQSGRMETTPFNLGEDNSRVVRIDVSGGRTSYGGGMVKNFYSGSGPFRFEDDGELRFFIRTADNPYSWTDDDWKPFNPGLDIPESFRGRFIQIAVEFFPSGDGETTPYLEELRITYIPDLPPLPPTQLTALARNGGVELHWKKSTDTDVSGYLIYFGTSRGDYFGESAELGASPINAGKRTSFYIDGLENGALYYFAVAAYDRGNAETSLDSLHPGEFSREVSARPLRTVE
jgi:hypothetical protein